MKNKSNALKALNLLPFMFEKNIGQHDEAIKFMLNQSKSNTYFTQSDTVLVLNKSTDKESQEVNILRINLDDSNKNCEIVGTDEFNCKINYFIGSDKTKWTTDIPIYEKITYKEVYPGIDLTYYGNEGKLEHDFIVSPGADYNNIKINYNGAQKLELDEQGNLIITLNDNNLKMSKPITYQEIEGKIVNVDSNFEIIKNNIKFNISNYDENSTLIIDPTLEYGSYLGGSSTGTLDVSSDVGRDIEVDDNQCAYIIGTTDSTIGFPISGNAYQQNKSNSIFNVFLLKIDTTESGSNCLKYGSYFGGTNGDDNGWGIALYQNRYAYMTGQSSSTDFPTTPNRFQGDSGSIDAFLLKIDTEAIDGPSSFLFGTYLGGSNPDFGYDVAVDSTGVAYITGDTTSNDFPTTPNKYQLSLSGIRNAFLTKLEVPTDPNVTSKLLYSTFIGDNLDFAEAIAIDDDGNAYITGSTFSEDYKTTGNAYQGNLRGTVNAFLSKLDTPTYIDDTSPRGKMLYSTFIGGTNRDIGYDITIDADKNAYIIGEAMSDDFFETTPNGFQTTLLGSTDAFFVKMNTPNFDTAIPGVLLYGTYLGGNTSESGLTENKGYGVALDQNNIAYLTGSTTVEDLPITEDAYDKTLEGVYDIFLF